MHKIKDKERMTILNALKTGVVPNVGLKYMQVGRSEEIAQIINDLSHVESGGTTVKFIAGEYGAGKSFFLTLCKLMAHEKKMIVMNADITTEKILCASDGKAKALMTELIKNMSCRSRPEGNALKILVETWISKFIEKFPNPNKNDFYSIMEPVSGLALSNSFAQVLHIYMEAYQAQDQEKIEKCLKWMRAEYENKTDAKNDIGVSSIIDDADFYDVIKIYTAFAKVAGFSGVMVNIDELAVLIRQRAPLRNKNYETLLTIINDCHQGSIENLVFLFGATIESIENKEKGLFSYGALERRLASNPYARDGVKDLSGPVMRLSTLSKEEMFVLIHNLRDIYAFFEPEKYLIDEEGLKAFFTESFSKLGSDEHTTPSDIIKNFLSLLSVLETQKDKTWKDFIKQSASVSEQQNSGLVRLKVS